MQMTSVTLLILILVAFLQCNQAFSVYTLANWFDTTTTTPVSTASFSYDVCTKNQNLFALSDLILEPSTPVPGLLDYRDVHCSGQMLTIRIRGELASVVEQGSQVDVSVKYMRIRLLKQTFDLCYELSKLNESPAQCPVASGTKNYQVSTRMPDNIPHGFYNIELRVRDHLSQSVFCANLELQM